MTESDPSCGRFVEVNGVRLHYCDYGRQNAASVVVLHGLTGHAREFGAVAAALAQDFHVVVVDQRGHGRSGWADDYSPQLMADDIAALIDRLDLGRVTVIGHSMGAVNAWWLADRHPETITRLVVMDMDPDTITSATVSEAVAGLLAAASAARFTGPEQAVASYLEGYEGTRREALRDFVIHNVAEDADGSWRWRYDADGLARWMASAGADAGSHWAAVRRISCPMLVVRAGKSPFTSEASARRMMEALVGARLVEVPDAGHDIHIDHPEELVRQLRPFLGGL